MNGLLAAHGAWLARNHALLPRRPGGYTRTLLQRGEGFELIAMVWSPGALTPIHDHGDSRCATLVVAGSLAVEHFTRGADLGPERAALVAGEARVLIAGDGEALRDATELHRVATAGSDDAIAVHLYAVPLAAYRSFAADGRIAAHRSAYDLILRAS